MGGRELEEGGGRGWRGGRSEGEERAQSIQSARLIMII
jgi:hypothetical protein